MVTTASGTEPKRLQSYVPGIDSNGPRSDRQVEQTIYHPASRPEAPASLAPGSNQLPPGFNPPQEKRGKLDPGPTVGDARWLHTRSTFVPRSRGRWGTPSTGRWWESTSKATGGATAPTRSAWGSAAGCRPGVPGCSPRRAPTASNTTSTAPATDSSSRSTRTYLGPRC